jgi:DinB superfamily
MATTAASPGLSEVEVLREQAKVIHRVLRMNVSELTQRDSLIQPQPGGNCMNWVVGHLVSTYNNAVLPLLDQDPVLSTEVLKRYGRGSAELREPSDALPLETLLTAWDEATNRVDAGLAAITAEALSRPAPFSPRNNPNETVRSLLTILMFHQAYHCGQTGLLRRMAGKDGAMK